VVDQLVDLLEVAEVGQLNRQCGILIAVNWTDLIEEQHPTWVATWKTRVVLEVA
jgi:hypothetical protein